MKRIHSIDLLRGLVMIIMALDHIRDYFHSAAFYYDPLDLDKASPMLFFTRWVTHFCAPIFMLLTGASAFIVGERKGTKALSWFLFSRGLFLVIMEHTVINFGWYFNIHFHEFAFIVIWSLGVSMIALSAMIYLPKKIILSIGIILVAGHNALDGVHVQGQGAGAFVWSILHEPGFFQVGGKNVFVGYPLIPWIGTIALGYSLGSMYASSFDPAKRKRLLLYIGCGAILLFALLRSGNFYGDPTPWQQQSSVLYSFFSFIKVMKYPPSLLYLLATLGPALIFLYFCEGRLPGWLGQRIAVYGRVPMFYYIVHIYLIHIAALIATNFCPGFSPANMIWQSWGGSLQGYGFSLGVVYLVWISLIIVLFPACKWYDGYKQAHKEKRWLSYL